MLLRTMHTCRIKLSLSRSHLKTRDVTCTPQTIELPPMAQAIFSPRHHTLSDSTPPKFEVVPLEELKAWCEANAGTTKAKKEQQPLGEMVMAGEAGLKLFYNMPAGGGQY